MSSHVLAFLDNFGKMELCKRKLLLFIEIIVKIMILKMELMIVLKRR